MGLGTIKFIDLENKALSGTAVEFDGIYDAIEGNLGKVLCLANIVVGNSELGSAFAEFTASGDDLVAEVFGCKITVTDDDEVTAEVIANPKVPVAPTTASKTYVLKATTDAAGKATIAWVEEE